MVMFHGKEVSKDLVGKMFMDDRGATWTITDCDSSDCPIEADSDEGDRGNWFWCDERLELGESDDFTFVAWVGETSEAPTKRLSVEVTLPVSSEGVSLTSLKETVALFDTLGAKHVHLELGPDGIKIRI